MATSLSSLRRDLSCSRKGWYSSLWTICYCRWSRTISSIPPSCSEKGKNVIRTVILVFFEYWRSPYFLQTFWSFLPPLPRGQVFSLSQVSWPRLVLVANPAIPRVSSRAVYLQQRARINIRGVKRHRALEEMKTRALSRRRRHGSPHCWVIFGILQGRPQIDSAVVFWLLQREGKPLFRSRDLRLFNLLLLGSITLTNSRLN